MAPMVAEPISETSSGKPVANTSAKLPKYWLAISDHDRVPVCTFHTVLSADFSCASTPTAPTSSVANRVASRLETLLARVERAADNLEAEARDLVDAGPEAIPSVHRTNG